MTLRDDPRTYKKPVEEGARAISSSKAWPAVFAAGSAEELARAVFERWRKCGFISDLGIEAIRAEEAGK